MFNRWRPSEAHDGVFERYLHGDGNTFYRERVQDVEPILAHNRRVANETDGRTPGGGRLLGSIPPVVYHEWLAEWTAQGLVAPGHMDAVNDLIIKRLRDSDYAKLRATYGGI